MTDGPAGFVVTVDPGDRVHFAVWREAAAGDAATGVLLVHGLAQTTWIWAPVARRLAATVPTVAMDLPGHGLSDAPTEPEAYDLDVLAEDVVAVAEGADLVRPDDATSSVVLVGHGFGATVAAAAAARLGERCAGLVLVDGGWEDAEASTGVDVDEFLRGLDEPPEVMASMRAFLRDRRGFDPGTWDGDQEVAARATVVETHAGRLVPATRPHALDACVRTMFAVDPVAAIAAVAAPVTALVRAIPGGTMDPERVTSLETASAARVAAGRAPIRAVPVAAIGHNLMRYRPTEVVAEILALAAPAAAPT